MARYEAGYVQRDEEQGDRSGLGMIGLAGPLLAELSVRRAALPHLEELTQATGETAAIAVWNGSNAIVVEQMKFHPARSSTAWRRGMRHKSSPSSPAARRRRTTVRGGYPHLVAAAYWMVLREAYLGLEESAHEELIAYMTTAPPSTMARHVTRSAACPLLPVHRRSRRYIDGQRARSQSGTCTVNRPREAVLEAARGCPAGAVFRGEPTRS